MVFVAAGRRRGIMKKTAKADTSGYIFPKKTESRASFLGKSASRAGIIGLHPLSGLVVGGLAGYFLWKKFDASWLFWGMLLIGFIAGCRNAYRDFRAMMREEESDYVAKKPPCH